MSFVVTTTSVRGNKRQSDPDGVCGGDKDKEPPAKAEQGEWRSDVGWVGQHRGTGWIHTQGGAGGSCCPVPHTAHPGSHLCTHKYTHKHTPVSHELLLPWAYSKVPLDTALGTPAWPNRDISAQVDSNQLLIWISEREERKEPGGMAWRIAGKHTDDPASCGMSLFDFCPSFPHTSAPHFHIQVPSSLSIFSPFSPRLCVFQERLSLDIG